MGGSVATNFRRCWTGDGDVGIFCHSVATDTNLHDAGICFEGKNSSHDSIEGEGGEDDGSSSY